MSRKPLFDFLRQLLGRGFTQSEVDAIDALLDLSAPGQSCTARNREISPEGIALIKRFEGCARRRADGRVEAYPDPGTGCEPWTIGWGATGPDIGPDTVWSQAQCDARLIEDVARHARDVAKAIGDAPTSQAQFEALVSFHFNTGAIARATLTNYHTSGRYKAAVGEFGRWIYAGGRVLPGLVRRRKYEAALYRSGS